MKFLVITRPNGADHDLSTDRGSAAGQAGLVEELLKSKVVEVAYAFIGGGSAYVVNADTAKQLAVLVRTNPLFSTQSHEIIPVADAHDFLKGVAAY